jgi:predicted nucleic acid-binding Zn ribbon protein
MRKNNTQPIKSVIKEYIDALGHRQKLREVNIVSSWEKIMGKAISNHTKSVFIKRKVLFVKLDSPVLRNELLMRKESIINHLNNYAGEVIIEKVILQ